MIRCPSGRLSRRLTVAAVLAAAVATAACGNSTAPESPVGVARVREATVAPVGTVGVEVSRTAEGVWYANACAVRLLRREGGAWVLAATQPPVCEAPWQPFARGQVARLAVPLPQNMQDGAHRLQLLVLPFQTGPLPVISLARQDFDEVRLQTNTFEVPALR